MRSLEDKLIQKLKKRNYWMGLEELIKKHGTEVLYKQKFLIKPGKVMHQSEGFFWIKLESGSYLTISPEESKSGWSLYMKPVEVTRVQCCVWRYLGNPSKIIRYEFREDVKPWEYFSNDPVKSNLRYWYKCDDEDTTLMVTQ